MGDYIPSNDDACDDFLSNFSQKCAANQSALHLSASDTSNMTNLSGLFNSDLGDEKVARNAADTASTATATSRKNAVAFARVLAQRIQADPTIPDELRT